MSYDPHPIRWVELVLPHPEDPKSWLTLRADGPFALRNWYFAPGTRAEIHLHLEGRTKEGGLTACLYCGKAPLVPHRKARWGVGGLAAVPGLALAYFQPIWGVVWILGAFGVAFGLGKREIVCRHCGTQHRGFRESSR